MPVGGGSCESREDVAVFCRAPPLARLRTYRRLETKNKKTGSKTVFPWFSYLLEGELHKQIISVRRHADEQLPPVQEKEH